VCESGAGVLVVPTAAAGAVREALGSPPGGSGPVEFQPVVTSGTIASVKERLGIRPARRR
jgi:hypothetical protein